MNDEIAHYNSSPDTTTPSNVRVKLVSRLKYPVMIRHGGETYFLAPHGTIFNLEPDQLEMDLPNGVQMAEYNV